MLTEFVNPKRKTETVTQTKQALIARCNLGGLQTVDTQTHVVMM